MSQCKTITDSIFEELVSIRRDIHQHPELGMQEIRTSAIIRSELEKMGMDEVLSPLPTGVVGILHGGKGTGKCVAMRADIDALPVEEETGLPFSSQTSGIMHACGHDLHTTMLLGVARVLCRMRDSFAGTVKFIFQPSEDTMPGGARAMVAAGVMENPHVDAIYGIHVNPSEDGEVGTMNLYKGYFTTAVDLFDIDVNGKAGHGSAPHTADDAIVAAGYLIAALQQIVSRRVDPMDTAVFTIGTMSGGSAVNIISGQAKIAGVSRYFTDTARQTVLEQVDRICDGIGTAFGCRIDVKKTEGYAATFNDAALVDVAEAGIRAELGADKCRYIDKPFSGSEDFSFYSRLTGTPGAFFMIDAGHGKDRVSLHNAKCVFSEEVIRYGVAGMARVLLTYLEQ
ncbi:MAG: amidohydrolase [Clostridiales bacterium]|nr:amidohydrolase [Clostridiales bacterium]